MFTLFPAGFVFVVVVVVAHAGYECCGLGCGYKSKRRRLSTGRRLVKRHGRAAYRKTKGVCVKMKQRRTANKKGVWVKMKLT